MRRVGALIVWTACALIGGLVGAHLYLAHALTGYLPAETGELVALPRGVSENGGLVSVESSRCTLVRFGSRYCAYSTADDPSYLELRRGVSASGCAVVELAPQSGSLPVRSRATDEGVHRLAGVSREFVLQLRFPGTPTTALLDAHGRVLWDKVGPLRRADLERASTVALQLAARR